jgi:hypothetical protein
VAYIREAPPAAFHGLSDLPAELAGGADAARFTINSSTGALAFAPVPDYEAPTDVGGNNVYAPIWATSRALMARR